MKPYIYIIALVFSAFVSCSKDPVMVLLDTVESKILTEPEVAYSLVRTIHDEDLQTRSAKARYALLYTWASYRNYYDTNNDSLIRIAYDYYVRDGYGTDADRMNSCRLLGIINKNAQDYSSSMLAFQEAASYGHKIGDDYMLGAIYSNLTELSADSYGAEEMKYARLASYHFERSKAKRFILDSKLSIAYAYYHRKKFDSCLYVLDSVHDSIEQSADTFIIRRCLAIMAGTYFQLGEYKKSKAIYGQLKDWYSYTFDMASKSNQAIMFAKEGDADAALGILESAEKQMVKSIDSVYYFKSAYYVHKILGNTSQEVSFLENYSSLQSRLHFERLYKSVMLVQRDRLQQELELEKSESEKRQILWGASLVILILLGLGGFLIMRRQNQLQRLEVDRTALQVSEIKHDLHQKIEELTKLRRNSEKQSRQINSLFTQHLDELNRLCISYESGQNTLFAKNSIYKEVQSIVKSLSAESETFSEIESLVDELYNGALTKIKQDFPKLKEIDYKYFCYAFAGFSSRAISLLLDESIDNIYQKRSRWKAKIEQLPEPNRSFYLSLLV